MKPLIITQAFKGLIYFICLSLLLFSDFRNVFYDSEPDYLANALYILQSGYPINSHHPGTVTYYLVSFVLLLTNSFSFDLASTIYVARIFLCALGSIIIFFCKSLKFSEIITVFLFIALLDGFYFTLNVISAELLLLPLSFLLIDQIKRNKSSIGAISLVYGLMLNVKFSSILLLPYLLTHFIFTFKIKKIYKLTKFVALSLIIFIFLSFPVLSTFHFSIIRSLVMMIQLKELIFNNPTYLYFFFIIFFTVFISIIIFIINSLKTNKFIKFITQRNILFYLHSFFGISIAILLFINPIEIRHFIPVLPFIICLNFFEKFNARTFSFLNKSFFICFVLIWSLYRYPDFEISKAFDQQIEKQPGKVLFIQTAGFSSEIRFIEWMNYAYGKSSLEVPKEWLIKYKKLSENKTEFLNTRNFSNSFKNSEERNIFKDSYLYFYEKDFDSQVNSLLDKKTTLMLSPKDYDLIDSFLEKINLNAKDKLILVPENRQIKTSFYSLEKVQS